MKVDRASRIAIAIAISNNRQRRPGVPSCPPKASCRAPETSCGAVRHSPLRQSPPPSTSRRVIVLTLMAEPPPPSPAPGAAADGERYLAQLERTVLHAASTGSAESSARLDAERCQSPDGLAAACLELLRRRGWGGGDGGGGPPGSGPALARSDAVTFYALTTVQRSPLLRCLPPEGGNFPALRSQLRHSLLTAVSHGPNLRAMPSYVVTKISVLLALLVREEYPVDWACPWRDVLAALRLSDESNESAIALDKMASMNMYLSFLDAISDEIVYPAAAGEDAGMIGGSGE